MDTGEQSRPAVPPSSGVDARPVVLVLVDDTIGSLASLLLAADIAVAQRGRLHVAHVGPPTAWTGMAGLAGMPVPASLLAEADHPAAGELQDRVGAVLALGAPVDWSFTWTRGIVHQTVTRLVSELSPAAVVVNAPRTHGFSARPSLARWLVRRPSVRAVVVPA